MQNRSDRRKHHYIYKITRDDGFYYIGMHSTDDLDDGYFGTRWIHNPILRKSTRIMKTADVPDGWVLGRRIYK